MAEALTWQAWATLGILVGVVVALLREWARPDLVLLGSLGLLLVGGILPPETAFAGFSNTAVLTIAALFVIAEGLQRTGAFAFLDGLLFSPAPAWSRILPRLMVPTAALSAFMNNTPIVAMLIPRIQQWAEQRDLSASKLLIPLSYAAILGGMITLIGTATNIVVSGLLMEAGYEGFAMFDLTLVGLPAMLVVVAFFALGGHRLLPDHRAEVTDLEEGLRDCLFGVKVAPDAPFLGQTVEAMGLRALGDAYLAHIYRNDEQIPARPDLVLQGHDELTFIGTPTMLPSLLEQPGLLRLVRQPDLTALPGHLPLYEAVVAPTSQLVGQTLKEANFREAYGGIVLGIQRRDQQTEGSLGQTPIEAGDLLLIEARAGFEARWNANRDEFYLVALRDHPARPPERRKAPLALLLFAGMIALVTAGVLPIVTAAFATALGMLATRCLRVREAGNAVQVSVLVMIAAALGLGEAVQATGLADHLADFVVALGSRLHLVGILLVLYVLTNLLAELITNKAAAVLMLPVALTVATQTGADPRAFALLICVAATASFISPIGYQTNLMVMSAGGYRYMDYVRVGIPVSLLVMIVAISSIYLFWL